ncbi:uncharacterized protein [Clytia hemisphaerica]|uniref:uncharacterized protein n=1 Tax=Clytia hemisphaerica TaxID=252671 RepID=UPI0034D65211
MKWYPKADRLSLCISDLNFAKKQRGKKPTNASNIIPTNLTRRHCASKVAEIFDITGMMTPIVAAMKLDLHDLSTRQLDWDDTIPTELRPIWIKHFETMTQLGEIQFRRAVIPEDAISTDIQTLDFGDASQSLVCVCIYARYTRRNGQFSSQLVFARSRTVPNGLSLPRAELMASLINTHTGEVVKRSFGQYHKSNIKFTDSQIALHWITNDEKPLKLWARNRVIDINRFSNRNQWFYINTADMMADIGTRRGATLEDVQPDSPWFNGHQWMHLPISDFPIKSAQDLRLSASDTNEVEKERMVPIKYVSTHHTMNLVQQRYKFSQYLMDPNRHRFSTVIRIFAYVRRYSKTLFDRSKDKSSSKSSNQQLQNIKVDVFGSHAHKHRN